MKHPFSKEIITKCLGKTGKSEFWEIRSTLYKQWRAIRNDASCVRYRGSSLLRIHFAWRVLLLVVDGDGKQSQTSG